MIEIEKWQMRKKSMYSNNVEEIFENSYAFKN